MCFRKAAYVETERQFLEGAMVKYEIIDVTFAAPERLLNSRDEGGISLLKDLCFIDEVDKEDHADSSELFGSDLSCLELLAEGLENHPVGQRYCLLARSLRPFM